MHHPLPDLLILGGGLSGGLIALAAARASPDRRIRIIEADAVIGGNHIWSFFESDIAAADRWLVEPLIARRWPSHAVRFPGYSRVIDQAYCSITSENLDAAVRAVVPPADIICASVADVVRAAQGYRVTLGDGTTIEADDLIDARGAGALTTLRCGYQKFLGQMLNLAGGHGLDAPIIMDATVDQRDGYRFVYCLPFSDTEVFVEDTYYTNGAALDVPLLMTRIAAYAAAQGWNVTGVGRAETGVLPVVYGGDLAAYWASTDAAIPKAGVRAGRFHALTGYSLPDAVRFAVAPRGDYRAARAHWRRQSYYRLLGNMLFNAAAPDQRYRVFERFYKLAPTLIARFYSGQSTRGDKLRILMGKPPVPLMGALGALFIRR